MTSRRAIFVCELAKGDPTEALRRKLHDRVQWTASHAQEAEIVDRSERANLQYITFERNYAIALAYSRRTGV